MKVVGFFALPFLAMALSAFANAQDSNSNQLAVTPQEFQGAKAQLEQQAQRIDNAQHDIDRLRSDFRGNTIAVKKRMDGVVSTQAQQGAAIENNAVALQQQSENAERTRKGLQAQIAGLMARTKGQSIILAVVCVGGLLLAAGMIFFVRWTMDHYGRRVAEDTQLALEHQRKEMEKELEKTRRALEEQRKSTEIEFPNPPVDVMISVCANLRKKDPDSNTVFITTVLDPSPKNGLLHPTTIKGIRAVFRPGILAGQKPAIYFPGSTSPVPVNELKKYAERFAYEHGLVVSDKIETDVVVDMLRDTNQRTATQS